MCASMYPFVVFDSSILIYKVGKVLCTQVAIVSAHTWNQGALVLCQR